MGTAAAIAVVKLQFFDERCYAPDHSPVAGEGSVGPTYELAAPPAANVFGTTWTGCTWIKPGNFSSLISWNQLC